MNPDRLARLIDEYPILPSTIVREDGLADMLKSVTVRLIVAERVSESPDPVTVIV